VGQAGRPGDRAPLSDPAIQLARSLAAELGLTATFVRSDLYDLPAVLDGQFDVVYTSRGVLGWLPDLGRWAEVVAHFLRPGGVFYVTEIHPVAQVFAEEPQLRLGYPYFPRREPIASPVQGFYADRTAQVRQPVEYGWVHSMGEIVSAVAGAGLRIQFLHEFPFVDWPVAFLVHHDDGTWRLPPDAGGELPLFFSLRATKS
jgi:SAM-dependent methyltransferase